MKQFDFNKIKVFREDAGLTQEALAILLSTEDNRVYTQQVSDWERGASGGLTVKSLVKLCDALKKSTDDFFVENNGGQRD
jgi:transcriptional regulator with XRE-family HTH domain